MNLADLVIAAAKDDIEIRVRKTGPREAIDLLVVKDPHAETPKFAMATLTYEELSPARRGTPQETLARTLDRLTRQVKT